MSDIREASLEPDRDRLPGFWWQAGPFALLGTGALWLWKHYPELPARLPVHWNARGEVDRYVARTPVGAAMPLIIGAAICLFLLLLQVALRYGSPRALMRFVTTRLVLGIEYFLALLFCGIFASMVTGGRMLAPVLVLCFGGALALVVLSIALLRGANREPLRNPSGWRGGFFYVAPDDPALWVPKRYGYGYTLNWSHPAAIPMLIVLVAVPIAIAVFAATVR